VGFFFGCLWGWWGVCLVFFLAGGFGGGCVGGFFEFLREWRFPGKLRLHFGEMVLAKFPCGASFLLGLLDALCFV